MLSIEVILLLVLIVTITAVASVVLTLWIIGALWRRIMEG